MNLVQEDLFGKCSDEDYKDIITSMLCNSSFWNLEKSDAVFRNVKTQVDDNTWKLQMSTKRWKTLPHFDEKHEW